MAAHDVGVVAKKGILALLGCVTCATKGAVVGVQLGWQEKLGKKEEKSQPEPEKSRYDAAHSIGG